MKIAYVTYEDQGKYTSKVENEDIKLLHFLQAKGLDLTIEVWSDQNVSWEVYDLALIKSPWDYFDRIQDFYEWLDKIEKSGLRMLNPFQAVRWNADKHYLKDIANTGLRVTPTHFIEKNEVPDLELYFNLFSTETLIIKPVISGGSKNTFKFARNNISELTPKIVALLQEEAFMLQPFLREIQEEGEWSFLFFNGKFSHSLLKKAKAGDFRVQHYLGGTIHSQNPPPGLLDKAQQYVDRFARECLYARVDGVVMEGEFHLMELELIEPFLFLFTHPESYKNYYTALKEITKDY